MLQEPHLTKSGISNLTNKMLTVAAAPARAALYFSNEIKYLALPSYMTRDLAVANIDAGYGRGVIVASLYMDINDPVRSPHLIKLLDMCRDSGQALLIGADTNAHSTMWSEIDDNNSRGDELEEILMEYDLHVHNCQLEKPTFVNRRCNTIIDVTMTMNLSDENLVDWHVVDEVTHSDHKAIRFTLERSFNIKEKILTRNWNKLNVAEFNKILDDKMRLTIAQWHTRTHWSEADIEMAAASFDRAAQQALDQLIPERPTRPRPAHSWWTPECQNAQIRARNAAKRLNKLSKTCSDQYNQAYDAMIAQSKLYKKEIYRAKRTSWRNMVTSINEEVGMARLTKILKGSTQAKVGQLKDEHGLTMDSTSTMDALARAHFPGSRPYVTPTPPTTTPIEVRHIPWLNNERFTAAVRPFGNYKAPGPDGLKPIAIKNFSDTMKSGLNNLYAAIVTLGYTPIKWREAKVIMIPKGKSDLTDPRAFRPISLTSFLLKTLERMVLWKMEEDGFATHKKQFGFKAGASTDDAISKTVDIIEAGLHRRQYVGVVFMDIKAAFDTITPTAIDTAFRRKQVCPEIRNWYRNYITSRTATLDIDGVKRSYALTLGTPQGGVLSPTGWNAPMDDAVRIINEGSISGCGFADDSNVIATAPIKAEVEEKLQLAINKVKRWADQAGLTISASKTIAMLFTRKRGDRTLNLKLGDMSIKQCSETVYLGITIDENLSWGPHIKRKTAATKRLLHATKTIAKSWGPAPALTRWMWTNVMRPSLTYGAMTWAKATERKSHLNKLTQVQRLAMLQLAHVRPSTPTMGLEILYNIPPIDLTIKLKALTDYWRIQPKRWWLPLQAGLTNPHRLGHVRYLDNLNPFPLQAIDTRPRTRLWDRQYEVDLQAWTGNDAPYDVVIYTDGSQIEEKTGIGVVTKAQNRPINMLSEHIGSSDVYTVFQAEITAIRRAAEVAATNHVAKTILILVDSQAALHAMGKIDCNKKSVEEAIAAVNYLAAGNELVKLQWVKAHVGTIGNELADQAAKAGARNIGKKVPHTTYCALSRVKQRLKRHMLKTWSEHWASHPHARQTKYFLPRPDGRSSRVLTKLSRPKLGLAVQLLTGHCYLKRHQHLVDPVANPTPICRLCTEGDETPIHLISDCPALTMTRRLNLVDQCWKDRPPDELLRAQIDFLITTTNRLTDEG